MSINFAILHYRTDFCVAGEMSESGLRSTIGNRVCAKSVPGVRIPISPPEYVPPKGVCDNTNCINARKGVFFYLAICFWKDGRAAECGGLENRFTGTPGNEGSNPSPSARISDPVYACHGRDFCLIYRIVSNVPKGSNAPKG